MNLALVKEQLLWDFQLEDEFKQERRRTGYGFVIDLYEKAPQLALYRIGPFSSHTDPLEQQPPTELLLQALSQARISDSADGLYPINQQLKQWIQDNLLQERHN